MSSLEVLLSVALGIGLAAAVGLRIFLPMLVVSVAAWTGHLHLSAELAWLGTLPAMVMLGVAAVAEIAAYYLPGVDHLLDAIASPLALVAGTVLAAAVMADLPPIVKWTTAVIAGGGVAGLTYGTTALLRAKSAAATGGLGNPLVATGELGGALLVSILAIAAPIAALALVIAFCWLVVRLARRLFRSTRRPVGAAPRDAGPGPG